MLRRPVAHALRPPCSDIRHACCTWPRNVRHRRIHPAPPRGRLARPHRLGARLWRAEAFEVTAEDTFEGIRNAQLLPFDFTVKCVRNGTKVIVEVDGRLHFMDWPDWRSRVRVVCGRDTFKAFIVLTVGAAPHRAASSALSACGMPGSTGSTAGTRLCAICLPRTTSTQPRAERAILVFLFSEFGRLAGTLLEHSGKRVLGPQHSGARVFGPPCRRQLRGRGSGVRGKRRQSVQDLAASVAHRRMCAAA